MLGLIFSLVLFALSVVSKESDIMRASFMIASALFYIGAVIAIYTPIHKS